MNLLSKELLSSLITLIFVRIFRLIFKASKYDTFRWIVNIYGIIIGIITFALLNPLINKYLITSKTYSTEQLRLIGKINEILITTIISKFYFSIMTGKSAFSASNIVSIFIGVAILSFYNIYIAPLINRYNKNDYINSILKSVILLILTDYVDDYKFNNIWLEISIAILSTIISKSIKKLL